MFPNPRDILKECVRDPEGVLHRLDWYAVDWMTTTACNRDAHLINGWVGVPLEWRRECAVCFDGPRNFQTMGDFAYLKR